MVGRAGLEVLLGEWAIFLLNLGSGACRGHRFGVTGCVLVRTEVGLPRHMLWGRQPPSSSYIGEYQDR